MFAPRKGALIPSPSAVRGIVHKLELSLDPPAHTAWLRHPTPWLMRGEEPDDDEDDDSGYEITSDEILPLQRLRHLRQIDMRLPSHETIEDWGGDEGAVGRFIFVLECRFRRGWLSENAALQTFRMVSGEASNSILRVFSCVSPRMDPFD